MSTLLWHYNWKSPLAMFPLDFLWELFFAFASDSRKLWHLVAKGNCVRFFRLYENSNVGSNFIVEPSLNKIVCISPNSRNHHLYGFALHCRCTCENFGIYPKLWRDFGNYTISPLRARSEVEIAVAPQTVNRELLKLRNYFQNLNSTLICDSHTLKKPSNVFIQIELFRVN